MFLGEEGSSFRSGIGTLYLHEPQFLPRDLQARLCTFFAEPDNPAGMRIIAGCSIEPLAEIKSGRLLEDLYFTLSALVINLPPLRELQADLPAFVEEFLKRAQASGPAGSDGPLVTALSPEAWEIVRSYFWPGNLRELYSVLQTACRRTSTSEIDAGQLPAPLRLSARMAQTPGPEAEKPLNLDQVLEQAERRLIVLALRKAQGNRSRAAELLSIWRPRLLRRMEALGISEW
jgi:DNA-binding NtrC family response regulator